MDKTMKLAVKIAAAACMAFLILCAVVKSFSEVPGTDVYGTQLELERDDTSRLTYSVHMNYREIKGQNISNFDVSPSGKILVCLKGGAMSSDAVNVYDSDGTYLYSAKYSTSGASHTFWIGEEAAVYFVRGGTAVTLNEHGTTGAYSVKRSSTLDSLTTRRTIKRGGTAYKLNYSFFTERPFIFDATRCVMETGSQKQTIYKNDSAILSAMGTIIVAASIVAGFSFAVSAMVKGIERNNTQYQQQAYNAGIVQYPPKGAYYEQQQQQRKK